MAMPAPFFFVENYLDYAYGRLKLSMNQTF